MKKLAIRKTAGLMALIMTISLLLPVIAYAGAKFISGTYDPVTGRVTATVYLTYDVYEQLVDKDKITIQVYDGNMVFGAVYATYEPGATDGYYYYKVDVTNATYAGRTGVNFNVYYPENVLLATYTPVVVGGSSGGGGFVGGGGTTPGSGAGVIRADSNGNVSADALKQALQSGTAVIEISGNVAKLPASALTVGGVVKIVAAGASYELPISVLGDLEALAEELGVTLDDLVIAVTIAELEGDAKANAEASIQSVGGTAVTGIFEFKVEAVAGDKSIELNFFDEFIKRSLNKTAEAGGEFVAVRIQEDGSLDPVPATENDDSYDVYSRTNSAYAVISVAPKSFADLKNHWAEKDINKLASKLIVNGTGADKFEPKRDVTRAEFAAMIVRALGLEASTQAPTFSDVASSAWYAYEVAAAAEAGIVKGDGTGKFRPNDKITRQELAAMVVRAQALAKVDVNLSDAEVASVLAGFKDAGQIGGWAKAEFAAAVKSGVVKGTAANTAAPTATATRAEAAAMIIRLLNNAGFIG